MDSLSLRVLNGQVEGHLRELKRRTVRRGEGISAGLLWLYRAENIRRAADAVPMPVEPYEQPGCRRSERRPAFRDHPWSIVREDADKPACPSMGQNILK
jgi:hypothetical protein